MVHHDQPGIATKDPDDMKKVRKMLMGPLPKTKQVPV